jgi:lipoyl(octanoyl) transferase
VTPNPGVLEIVLAGRTPYREALVWQRALAHDRLHGRLPHDVLLLLEHDPVITLGRASQQAHLLDADGIEVIEVERGGDVTYHGPGQLVGYPILDLRGYREDLHWYLRTLEQALIDALAELAIAAGRRPGYTGVWTRAATRKIASIGVHVKQWVTWHGFALNVTTALDAFARIVPCGIPDVAMTSVAQEVAGGMAGDHAALWDRTVAAVSHGFERAFQVSTRRREPETLALHLRGLSRFLPAPECPWTR